MYRKPVFNRAHTQNVPKYGVDPGQKRHVVMALSSPADAYRIAHQVPVDPNQPPPTRQEIRRSLKANERSSTGSFYIKLSLTARGQNRLRDHQVHIEFDDPEDDGERISYHETLTRLHGINKRLAEPVDSYRIFLQTQSMYRPLLRRHFETLFYRKEKLDKSSARMRSLRTMGSYYAGQIDVSHLPLTV
jgi:hypothetical protein